MRQERDSPVRNLAKNLMWGAAWGMFLAAVYYPIGLMKYLLTQDPIKSEVLFLTRAFVATVAVGGVVGCGVGILRPLLSGGRWGAALIGMLVTIPLLALVVLDFPYTDLAENLHSAVYILLVSVVGGGSLGLFIHHLFAKD